MSIVNFSIPKTLEKRIEYTIKQKGFASRAEFFRFAAIRLIEEKKKENFIDEEERTRYLVESIKQEIARKYKGKKIPSIEEQLKDI